MQKKWFSRFKENWFWLIIAILMVLATYTINYFTSTYTSYEAPVACVPDIILNNIHAININFIFSWGVIFIFLVFVIYSIYKVDDYFYNGCQLSFLILVRSFSIILTHLATPVDCVGGNFPGIFNVFKFANDQFFSGHVAFSLLGFYLFKESKIRWFFLIGSIIMGITVLLMHQHYTIDVFAAFFITYGCYRIIKRIFKK